MEIDAWITTTRDDVCIFSQTRKGLALMVTSWPVEGPGRVRTLMPLLIYAAPSSGREL